VDPERLHLRRDTAGKALADRNTKPTFNFLLEAAGRARGKFIGLLVEKQDRCSVDIEDLDDPLEKRIQEPLEVQICERRLGDALKLVRKAVGLSSGGSQRRNRTRGSADKQGLR
jgi:hypothetical protein